MTHNPLMLSDGHFHDDNELDTLQEAIVPCPEPLKPKETNYHPNFWKKYRA